VLRFTRKRRAVAALRVLFGLAVLVFSGAQALASPRTSGGERLPDLDQETPSLLQIVSSRSGDSVSYRLGFRSAVRNIGAGPFVIDGRRTFPASDLVMEADQLVQVAGSSARRIRGVGELRYVRSTDHQHWHLVGFDHYELRRAGDTSAVVTDRKSGFCLGDRYVATARRLPAMPPMKVYRSRCGLGQTGLQRIREGISVGYGDDYDPFLEYQDLPLSGLPDGRYVLVHHVNADGRLREISSENNAASVLLDLRWDAGKPVVRILASCPDTDRCDGARSVPASR
jgi:Lysyl oxidase